MTSATHLPVSTPASPEACSTVAGTPTVSLWTAAGLSICEVRVKEEGVSYGSEKSEIMSVK